MAVVMAMSTCGTEACAATLEQTEAKPPPKPWMICVQTTSASDACAPREWIMRPTPLYVQRRHQYHVSELVGQE